MVTVYPLSWVFLFTDETPARFLMIEAIAAVVGVGSIVASGVLADRVGRRTMLAVTAAAIAAFSGFAPQLLGAGEVGEATFMILRSEEHTSELQSLMRISYAVFCLKKKKDIDRTKSSNGTKE